MRKRNWSQNMFWQKVLAFIAVFSIVFSTVAPARAVTAFVEVCHQTGAGYNLLSVNSASLSTHLSHGDVYPVPEGGCASIEASPVTATTIVVTANTSIGENQPGWMFNRDASTSTPFAFDNTTNSIGSGSLHILPIGSTPADKMIAENFINKPIADINGISYDFKIGAGGTDTQEEQFYMNVYANFGESDDLKFYDCRYNVVPTIGSTGGFTTVSFDPHESYPVTTRTGGSASPYPCPSVPADMDDLSAGSNIRMFALNVGDTLAGDAGLDGFFDKVVVSTPTLITTYDFEPAPPRIPININVQKVWQDSNGNPIAGPNNQDDITITVEEGDGDDRTCNYDDGELVCSAEINGYSGEPVDVTETGVPAGWEVVPGTVGSVIPTCPEESTECTVIVINKQQEIEPCGTELVVNGGFELPEITNPNGWDLFASGTPTLGWSVDEANSDTNATLEIQENVAGSAHGGNQLVELDSDRSVKIYQDMVTKIGGVYTLKFWTSPRPGQNSSQNQTEVKVGGNVLDTIIEDGSSNSNTVWTEHTYTFTATSTFTRIEFTDRGASNSYGGYLDDISVVEQCLSDVTICKLDNHENPLPGWEVMLKGDVVDTVEVSATSGTSSFSDSLPAGNYVFEASGTYVYRPGSAGDISDAAYSKRVSSDFGIHPSFYSGDELPWVRNLDLGGIYSGYLGIRVNGVNFDWGTDFNSSHEYLGLYNHAADGSIPFGITDDNYSDNSGSLTVTIRPVLVGITGENGCATITKVPYDTYKVDEVMQDGWSNVSGQNVTAVVSMPTDYYTLVNQCEENCKSTVVLCKQDDSGNPLAGWDLYLKGDKLETISVNSANINGANSVNELSSTQSYLVEISGQWQNRGFETVDAAYTTPDSWVTPLDAPIGGWPDDLLETQVNNAFVNWGEYNSDHVYSLIMTGTDAVANFAVFDGDTNTNTKNSGWYSDNVGSLTVDIYPIYVGTTSEKGGCATIENVPYGQYELGEVMQEGWVNVSGEGRSVLVNEPIEADAAESEIFTWLLVNECTDESCEVIEPCVEGPITGIVSGTQTYFAGLKEGGPAPINLSNSNNYPSGTTGNAVAAGPTGYSGAWNGSANDPSMSGAVYVSNDSVQPTNSGGAGYDGSVDSWRLFSHTFTIPAGATSISSPVLRFAADNEVTVFLDENQIGFSNSFSTVTSTAPLVLTLGTHTLEFAVKNSAFEATNNPTGLIYKLDDITYNCSTGGGGGSKGSILVTKNTLYADGEFGFSGSEGISDFTITTVEGTGSYLITDLTPGFYSVYEGKLVSPWYQLDSNCAEIEVLANQQTNCTVNNTYGFSVSGKVYHDNNPENGQYDGPTEDSAGEGGLEGWEVYIDMNNDNTQNEEEPSATSNSNGDYIITGLVPGCYTVRESVENNWDQTAPFESDFEYEVAVGGATCESEELIGKISSFFIKSAQAQAIDPLNATGKDFGNVESSSNSSSSSGSSSNNNNDNNGSVLGDSTNVPSGQNTELNPRVLGAATTLPVTGQERTTFMIMVLYAAVIAGGAGYYITRQAN